MNKPPFSIQTNEVRTIQVTELRASTENRTLAGYAAVFNEFSENMGGFFEVIEPGAFDDVLGEDVRCLYNHDANFVLGRTASNTLTLSVDEKGLKYVCQLPDTQQARDLIQSVERGDVNQCSFKFQVKDQDWYDDDQRGWVRSISKVLHLYDVGPVTFPAYHTTEATVRSFEEARSSKAGDNPDTSASTATGQADSDTSPDLIKRNKRARKLKLLQMAS